MRVPRRGLVAGVVCVAGAGLVRGQWTVQSLLPPEGGNGGVWSVDSGLAFGTLNLRAVVWNGTQVVRDLTPAAAEYSEIFGSRGGIQVGYASITGAPYYHAGMWSGSAASWVDLSVGFGDSEALAVDGEQQVGYYSPGPRMHACIWSGSPGSLVDLNPSGPGQSIAYGVEGGVQVGQVVDIDERVLAAVWHGTADSVTYLAGGLATPAAAFAISDGNVVGFFQYNAFIWSEAGGYRSLGPGAANAIYAGRQAGSTNVGGTTTPCIWNGTASSRELLPLPPGSYTWLEVNGIWSNGLTIYVVGNAQPASSNRTKPFLWTRPLETCYANCDGSTVAPVLNVNDFLCFMGRFAAGDSYANCDGSTEAPVLNVQDFVCFQGRFAAGCG